MVCVFAIILDDGTSPLSSTWDGDSKTAVLYIIQRINAAHGVFEKITPRWCREYILATRHESMTMNCDMYVFGSNRGFSNDALMIMIAENLRLPTVTELLNLFADPVHLPTAIIGPSHYSINHESIKSIRRSTKAQRSNLRVEVVSPGVDLNRFDVSLRKSVDVWRHPACPKNTQCIVIGFMARMNTEKNPGLFVMVAHHIFSKLRLIMDIRFVMIGAGNLLERTKQTVDQLGMTSVFYFPGWLVGPSLPRMLAGIDIIINPSLRAWSETFCIANLEAMSMGVAVVTFAVGGVGEYIVAPSRCQYCVDAEEDGLLTTCNCTGSNFNEIMIDRVEDFDVVDNALVLNNASPLAVGNATIYLIKNNAVRQKIVKNGIETVQKYFSVQRQIKQYSRLYRDIYDTYHQRNRV